LQKFDFQLETIKPDKIGHPTIEPGKFGSLGGFEGGFLFYEN